jgi:hypothetical protein
MDNDIVTWGSMTPGERWCFLDEISICEDVEEPIRDRAVCMAKSAAFEAFPEALHLNRRYDPFPEHPGYQARYDVTLAHVKGVMDAS